MKFFFVGLFAISFYAYPQTPFTSNEIPGKVSDIRGMLMDDDIFLSMVLRPMNAKPFIQSCFIKPDGSVRSVNVDAIGDKPIIGGIRRGTNTFLYYVDNV